MTGIRLTGSVAARMAEIASDFAGQLGQAYEERIADLEGQVEALRQENRQLKVDRELDVITRTKYLDEQLAQAHGDNFELTLGYQSACQERDAARARLNEVLPELAELRARDARRDAEMERLAAQKTDLQVQLDAARWQLYQLQLDREEDKGYVPERTICPRCKGNETEYRRGDGYHCRDCDAQYEPYPREER